MTTSSVRTLVLLPVKGVAVAVTCHSSGVSLMVMHCTSSHAPTNRNRGTRP